MKPCFKCQAVLPLSEFYRHPMMADGHLGKCKACTRRDVRANRRAKPEHYREYDRTRFHRNAQRRTDQYETAAALRQEYPEKYRARMAVNNAVRDGRLVRQPCELCGATEVEGHHDDYSRPLDVRWLCRQHHTETHHPLEEAG